MSHYKLPGKKKPCRLGILFLFYTLLSGSQSWGQEVSDKKSKMSSKSFVSKQQTGHTAAIKPIGISPVLNFREAARQSTLATVKIQSFFPQKTPLNAPDFYYDFFNQEFVSSYVVPTNDSHQDRTGSASGVLISNDGYIVTNFHVINMADRINVILSDRRSNNASVVGADQTTDLALLKITANSLPFFELGNSDSTEVGDIVLIVGNPLSFTSTVTQGIISYKCRNIAHKAARWTLQSYLQTDGVVNVGNSGGALVDLNGRLIGIVTAIASPNGVYAGYSFAIPVEIVKKTTRDLLNYGHVHRGSFGMEVTEMDAEKASLLNTPIVAGMHIDSVETNGAAQIAGLMPGDIITSIEGNQIESTGQFSEIVARSYPGQQIKVELVRNRRRHKISITLLTEPVVADN